MRRAVRKAIERGEVVSRRAFDNVASDRDRYERLWNENRKRNEELAKQHGSCFLSSNGHPIDLRPNEAVFWCESCRTQWPCDTFRLATGKNWKKLLTPAIDHPALSVQDGER